MKSIIEGLRDIIGPAEFWIQNGDLSGSWDYGLMCEYFAAVLILCIVVASVFRFLGKLVSR